MTATAAQAIPDPYADDDGSPVVFVSTEPAIDPAEAARLRALVLGPAPVVPDPVPGRRPEREGEYRAAVFNDDRLGAMAAHAGAVIVHHCHSTMQLFASQKTLAEWMHLAPTSTKSVRSAVRELVEHGYLEADGTAGQGQYRYRLTIPGGVINPTG